MIPVGVGGTGALADAIADALSARHAVLRSPGRAEAWVIVAADDRAPSADPLWRRRAELGCPVLPVYRLGGGVWLGPSHRPAEHGCLACAERRGRTAGPAARPPLTGLAAHAAAGLVEAWLEGDATSGVARLDPVTLEVTRHAPLPDPHCPECGGLPDDSAEGARLTLRPARKLAPDVLRTRELDAADLIRRYADDRCGLVGEIRLDGTAAFPACAAPVRLPDGAPAEHGIGRALDFRTARATCVTEALERFGGARPGGKRTVVRAAFREIADRAVDPRTLGLHPPENYDLPDFPYRAFHEDAECAWVHGYSFTRGEPVLVPESYAYYGLRGRGGDRPFVAEVSNGCALGGCLEEAVLHGLLEIAERDAFLLTWYARMPAPRVDLLSARDRSLPLMARTITRRTGYELHVFDIAPEQDVPCFWAMALDPAGDGERPAALCAAGSSLVPERGVAAALHELATVIEVHAASHGARRERSRAMAADSGLVRRMEDHAALYCDPVAAERLGFLFDGGRERLLTSGRPGGRDLRDDLTTLIGRYRDSGLDVIVVDQTTPEHARGGLACVKVIVPGAVPMSFGHRLRRVDGLPRLLRVPALLGRRDRVLHPADLNPHPHPFP